MRALFGKGNSNFYGSFYHDRMFIEAVRRHAVDLVRTRGFMTVNSVFEMLGIRQIEQGALRGWTDPDKLVFELFKVGEEVEIEFTPNSQNVFRPK